MELDYKPSGGYHFSFPDAIIQVQQQHPLLLGLHLCRAGYFPQFSGHVTKRPFGFAGSHILIYCTVGKGWFESGGERWTIVRGQLLFVLRDQPHSYGTDETDPWTIHWAHFAGEKTAVF
ncbi:MAG: AraC family ligand binding domain-containing protein, partial [Chloroflexota bacterium]